MSMQDHDVDLIKLKTVVSVLQYWKLDKGFEHVPAVYADYAHMIVVATSALDNHANEEEFLDACKQAWKLASEMTALFPRQTIGG